MEGYLAKEESVVFILRSERTLGGWSRGLTGSGWCFEGSAEERADPQTVVALSWELPLALPRLTGGGGPAKVT